MPALSARVLEGSVLMALHPGGMVRISLGIGWEERAVCYPNLYRDHPDGTRVRESIPEGYSLLVGGVQYVHAETLPAIASR